MNESHETFNLDQFMNDAQASYDQGQFFQWISDNRINRHNENYTVIHTALINAANTGNMDFLSLVYGEEVQNCQGFDFFTIQNFYLELIPDLEVDADTLMDAVSRLVELGENDLAANEPNRAFRSWLIKRPTQTRNLLNRALENPNQEFPMLTFVLEAGAEHDKTRYHTAALELLKSQKAETRLSAITAISRIDVSSHSDLQTQSLQSLLNCVECKRSEDELGYAAGAILDVYARNNSIGKPIVMAALTLTRHSNSANLHFCFARSLLHNHSKFGNDVIIEIIETLKGTNPAYMGTIDQIDTAFSQCITLDNRRNVADCIESLINHSDSELKLGDFDSFVHQLSNNLTEQLAWMVLYWLRFGSHKIRSELPQLFRDYTFKGGYKLKLPLHEFAFSDEELLVISQRAIGYFLINAVTATSIIVFCLRHVKNKTIAEEISHILFDPLLINYSSSARVYLDKIVTKRAKNNVYLKKALAQHDNYLDGLRSINAISEMAPSPSQKQVQLERERQAYAVASKEAEKHSVMLSLVTRQLLLHGEGSVQYIKNFDSKLSRRVSKLSSHGISTEIPRLDNVDPVGFQHKIIRFRNSEPSK